MLSTQNLIRPTHAPTPRAPLSSLRQCALCGGCGASGSWLASGPVGSDQTLWVCIDCQHQLSRRVDYDGVFGG